ncbi:ATP-binding protein [Mucilaginibacter sp. 3215]|uniref:ATP-binding protein n=1 Tax=Mucilaginibacter sp. 3215 TaxID=3373912 RepID=UPI003D1D7FC5
MTQFNIELSTGNKFWTPKGLGAMGMDPHRAIAELVANSLDWRRRAEDNIHTVIEITIGTNLLRIRDNGVGMTSDELKNAIQLSVSNDDLRRNLRVRKGMFGMGMKVACLTLGWKIDFLSKPLTDNSIENKFLLNSRLLDNDEKFNEYRNKLHGTTIPALNTSLLGGFDSGTVIEITDLTHKSINPIHVRDALQEIFQPEIGVENVTISVVDGNNSKVYPCQKIAIPVFEESKIILDDLNLFVKDEDSNELLPIKGWIALMKTTASGSGEWGLHLFKNNQIIERFHQLPSRLGGLMPKNPHPVYGRVYGELHLDMCKPAFHKVGFDYSTQNWQQVRELLKKHLEVVMNASKDYKKSDYERAEQSIRSIQQHRRAVKKAISILNGEPEEANNDPAQPNQPNISVKTDPKPPSQSNLQKPEEEKHEQIPNGAIQLRDGQWFTIVDPIFDELLEVQNKKPWIYHYKKESRELAIVINTDSPVYRDLARNNLNEREVQIVVNWSIADCILFVLYDKFDYNLHDSSNFRDQQLSKLFTTV